MIEVRISGLSELDRALSELPAKLVANIVRGGLRAAAKVVEAEAKAAAPKRSGRLAKSIRTKSGIKRGTPYARVTAGGKDAFYAHMVETGTKAHEILPDGAKSLFLAGLFRELVEHPGAAAHPFMRPAMDTAGTAAVLAAAEYMRGRLSRQGIDTPDVFPEDTDSPEPGDE